MPKLCEFENCRSQASYGQCHNKPIRCKEHKENYKLTCMLCKYDNCLFYPNFGYEGTNKKIYCSLHKLDNMVSLSRNKCEYEDCKISASCNFPGLKVRFCCKHKEMGMINIVSKRCQELNCNKIPNFNFEGEKTAIYCLEHKLEGMINIKQRKCLENNCNFTPNFNYKNLVGGIYCSQHKKENMVNVNLELCIYKDCNKCPSCNYPNEKKRLYCCEHKLEGMINISANFCIEKSCNITALFNYFNEKKPIYCSKHKKENMVDIVKQKCKANLCLGTRANPKYKGYCKNCYQNLFPNDPLTCQIRSKTKEIVVRDFINSNFKGFQHDNPLWTGDCNCTHRRRIDHRKLIGNTLLCIETDENQHKNYNKVDEEIRYDDLYMIHGGKFIFIRFNPDKYTNKDGKSVNPFLYTRLPILKEEIEKQISRIEKEENTELLEIIKLYYNDYN